MGIMDISVKTLFQIYTALVFMRVTKPDLFQLNYLKSGTAPAGNVEP